MRTSAEIVQVRQKQEAKFICSACGADRGCDCSAPAIEKLAELKERERQRVRDAVQKHRKNKEKQSPVTVTDMPTEVEAEEDPQNYRTSFLLRADSAKTLAAYSGPVTSELIDAARSVVTAWATLIKSMETNRA